MVNTIGEGELREFSDKNQLKWYVVETEKAYIEIYEKGYTDVIDFWNINIWTGEIEKK